MPEQKNHWFVWCMCAIVTTLICGLVYAAVQQNYRQSANNPQIQTAEDVATSLKGQQVPPFTGQQIDMSQSLSTFILVYDATGTPITGTGQLNNTTPTLPAGVFQATKTKGEDRITWMPSPGLRFAMVVVPIPGNTGYIAVGRSLREIEKRETSLEIMSALAWLITLLLTALLTWWFDSQSRRPVEHTPETPHEHTGDHHQAQ